MKIAFYGAAHEVTGSCTVIYACGKTIMVDCGLEQGPDIYENCTLPFAPSQIDYVLLTHAHIHLIPMNSEKDVDFTAPKLKLTPEEFAEIAAKLTVE